MIIAPWGVEGWGNELLSVAGAPTWWGAVAPVFPPGLALGLRWGVQYLLLGGFALAVALGPRAAMSPGLWSTGSAAGSYPADRAATDPGVRATA